MLCATLMNQSINTMMSPTKSICRLVPAHISSPSRAAANTLAYRYDPYCWKALSSPAKNCISPDHKGSAQNAQHMMIASADFVNNQENYHVPNSTHTAHMSKTAPMENRLLYSQAAAPAITQYQAVARQPMVSAVPKVATHSPATAIPKAVLDAPSTVTRYAFVDFKHDSATYIAPFKVNIGDVVFVEGDRGEDVGVISGITTEQPSYPVPCRVLRRFVPAKDNEGLEKKIAKEQATIKSTQALADSLGLQIQILDTEFQFDYNKLTIYFASKNTHIDFRKLQRGLFREHRCRIWLSNMAEVEYQKKLPRCR